MRAALSLDLDNKWSYMKTHGDSDWQTYPSYIDLLVPRVLDLLGSFGWRITFFIVGQDAALEQHRDALAQIAARGHEIGNHSYFHEPWMHRREKHEIDDELARAEESISVATGKHTRGFRGPGFVSSRELLEVLVRRGYLYDASSLPTFIGPLGRYYYFRSAKLQAHERAERHDLFGKFTDGFRSNRRHMVHADGGVLKEIPVTTMPGLRLPIHVSYVLYAATISPALALRYFRTALRLCKFTGTEPSILLHPLDFLSGQECPELTFFPAMSLDPGVKRDILTHVLHELAANYDVVPLEEVAVS
jgi:hypothetical protein